MTRFYWENNRRYHRCLRRIGPCQWHSRQREALGVFRLPRVPSTSYTRKTSEYARHWGFRYSTRVHSLFIDAGATAGDIALLTIQVGPFHTPTTRQRRSRTLCPEISNVPTS